MERWNVPVKWYRGGGGPTSPVRPLPARRHGIAAALQMLSYARWEWMRKNGAAGTPPDVRCRTRSAPYCASNEPREIKQS